MSNVYEWVKENERDYELSIHERDRESLKVN